MESMYRHSAGESTTCFKYKGMFDSGCFKHMTGNKALLTDYLDIDGGFVVFGGGTRGGNDKHVMVEVVNTACYVLNKVLCNPLNKDTIKLIIGKAPSISFMRPFGCPVTILNTLDPLGKFDGVTPHQSGNARCNISINITQDDR
ncbi:hypothetical protein Tco_1546983 [Tanacetum coccineum]